VDPSTVSALIGRGGSNCKRICREAGAGTFLRAYNSAKGQSQRVPLKECDRIHIEAYSEEAVRKAGELLKQDEQAQLKGSAPSRPQTLVRCDGKDSKAVGTVIGSKGSNIRKIMREAGSGCYIVHKRELGGFEVTADTKVAVAFAATRINTCISDFHQEQREWARRRKFGEQEQAVKSTSSGSRFDAFLSDSEDDEPDEGSATASKQEYQKRSARGGLQRIQQRRLEREMEKMQRGIAKAYSTGGIRDKKQEQQARWRVRQELAKKINPKTGGALYEPYDFYVKDRVTGKTKKLHASGAGAVPWKDVDEEMARRQKAETKSLEEARGLAEKARQEKYLAQLEKELDDEKSFPSLVSSQEKPKARQEVEASAKSSKVLQQCPSLLKALGDLASEESSRRPRIVGSGKIAWGNGSKAHLEVTEEQKEAIAQQNKMARRRFKTSGPVTQDLGGASSTMVDLSFGHTNARNVSMTIEAKPKMSWADMASEDEEDEDYYEDSYGEEYGEEEHW
jgi:hypothetical protein